VGLIVSQRHGGPSAAAKLFVLTDSWRPPESERIHKYLVTMENLDISQVKNWRSIITLIVFVLTSEYRTGLLKSHALRLTSSLSIDIIVLFPHSRLPIYIPRILSNAVLHTLHEYRVIPRVQPAPQQEPKADQNGKNTRFVVLLLPLNSVTAPLIADLFLLAILSIGRQEVHDGTIGADHISPLSIMIFFLSLAYIAISIDASGLIRYLAYRVLEWGRKSGGRLFFYLYLFFFLMTSFIGNDPIILSGTAFLAYMTRVASNIKDRKAWIHTQFAVANIGSAILVSSNPTNLVLVGAFDIKFIHYTANMVIPVTVTAIILFPFLLYIVFANKDLIPDTIDMRDLPDDLKEKTPVNPNIPHAKDKSESPDEALGGEEQSQLLLLQEVLHPWNDMKSAAFGAVIMATTLITLLALNAAGEVHEVYWVTLPAAVVMFSWDVTLGWLNRVETRGIARDSRRNIEPAEAEHVGGEDEKSVASERERENAARDLAQSQIRSSEAQARTKNDDSASNRLPGRKTSQRQPSKPSIIVSEQGDGLDPILSISLETPASVFATTTNQSSMEDAGHKMSIPEICYEPYGSSDTASSREKDSKGPATLVSLVKDAYWWLQCTFPAAMTVLAHLPFALVPFALSMFVLVQALVTKGWVPVFAYGWDHWVKKTGTVGAIGGMGFLSVVLCNVSLSA
jgi:Na+/H+ antiporter NhaD/arsenite permease-like protein